LSEKKGETARTSGERESEELRLAGQLVAAGEKFGLVYGGRSEVQRAAGMWSQLDESPVFLCHFLFASLACHV